MSTPAAAATSAAATYDWENLRLGSRPLPPRMPDGSVLPPFVSLRDADGIIKPRNLHPPMSTLNHSLSAHAYAHMDLTKLDPAGSDYAKTYWEKFTQLSWRQIEPVTTARPLRPPQRLSLPPKPRMQADMRTLPPRPPRTERLPTLGRIMSPAAKNNAYIAHAYAALDKAGFEASRRDSFMAISRGQDPTSIITRAKAPPNFGVLSRRRQTSGQIGVDYDLLDSLSKLATSTASTTEMERFNDLIGLQFEESDAKVLKSFDDSVEFSDMLNGDDSASSATLETPRTSEFEANNSNEASSPNTVEPKPTAPLEDLLISLDDTPPPPVKPKPVEPIVRRPKVRTKPVLDDSIEF